MLSLHLDAISDFPSTLTDIIYHLQDDLPIYFHFSLLSNLKFHFIWIINVADKAINLPPDTLLATAIFPCQHLYLHKVSNDTLKHEKTFKQDALHANLHNTVAQYFAAKERQTNKVISNNSSMLAAQVASNTLPDTIEGHPDSNDKEANVPGPEHKEPLTVDEVTRFNDALCPAQIITTLFQSPVHLQINQLSQLQKTDLIVNRMMEKIHKFPKFFVIKDILYKQTKDNLLIDLPSSLARLVVKLSHRNMKFI